jgi:succinate dehydrogenase / fumarate reductase membrane anchor subunit
MVDHPVGIADRARHSGLGHWRWQRYSAVIVLLLMMYFVFMLAGLGDLDHAAAMAMVGHPANAAALAVLVTIGLWHGTLGLQVVIEDYISIKGGRHAVLGIVRVVMGLIGLASLWAIASVAMGNF